MEELLSLMGRPRGVGLTELGLKGLMSKDDLEATLCRDHTPGWGGQSHRRAAVRGTAELRQEDGRESGCGGDQSLKLEPRAHLEAQGCHTASRFLRESVGFLTLVKCKSINVLRWKTGLETDLQRREQMLSTKWGDSMAHLSDEG